MRPVSSYGIRMLEMLRETPVESHLVISRSAEVTIAYETDWKAADVKALADVVYPAADIGAAISSGSLRPWEWSSPRVLFVRWAKSPPA